MNNQPFPTGLLGISSDIRHTIYAIRDDLKNEKRTQFQTLRPRVTGHESRVTIYAKQTQFHPQRRNEAKIRRRRTHPLIYSGIYPPRADPFTQKMQNKPNLTKYIHKYSINKGLRKC
jgi:hypothetical protein